MAQSTLLAKSPSLGSSNWTWLVLLLVAAASGYTLFASGVGHAATWWATPEYSHSYVLLALLGWIVWQRRQAILAERDVGSWTGVGIVAVGLLICLAGLAASMLRLPYLALLVGLAGLGVAGLGWRAMRRLWLPLFLGVFTLQLPGSLYVLVSLEFQLISSQLGAWILNALGISVFLDGNIVDLGTMRMQVAEACSGLRYLFPLAAFGFICAWLYRAPLWARALVLFATIPITIVTNSFRIAMTGVFLEYGNVHLAEGFMHLFEGWAVFLLALVLLFLLMWALAWTWRRPHLLDILDFDRIEGVPAATAGPATTRVGAPLAVAVGLMAVVAAVQQPLLDREQYVPARPGLITLPMVLGSWSGVPNWVDAETVRALGSDDQLLVDFQSPSAAAPVNLWIAYYDSQVGNAAIHSPKDCLPAGGWEFVAIDPIEAPLPPGTGEGFLLNRAVIAHGNDEMLMYYWLDMRGRKLTNEIYLKFVNLYDSIVARRSDGALIRLVTRVLPGESRAQAEARVAEMFALLYPQLAPHVGP